MRIAIAAVLALGTLLATASVTLAGWFWNGHAVVEGVDTRVRWEVLGDDNPYAYRAQLRLWVPEGADAEFICRLTDDENMVVLRDKNLSCRPDGVEVRARVRVLPLEGASGTGAAITLLADGHPIGSAVGSLRKNIHLSGVIPIDSPSCALETGSRD